MGVTMGQFPKVQAGTPIGDPSAEFHNCLVDIVNEHQRLGPRGGGHGAWDAVRGVGRNGTVVKIQNDSGAARDQFEILGIDSIIVTPTDNLAGFKACPILSCITPDVDVHRGKFVVLLEPLADNSIGSAMLSGVCVAPVTMDASGHKWADIKDGDAGSLQSAAAGSAKILYVESGTGVKWAVVNLGVDASPMHWGTLDAQLDQGDTEGVTVSLTAGGDVDNVLPPPTMTAGTHIDSGSAVLIAFIDGDWYVILAPC